MRRPKKRTLLLVAIAGFAVCLGYAAWTLAGLPPVKYYLHYGLDPYCAPTGEKVTVEGVTFVEIGPGVFRMGSDHLEEGGDGLGTICAILGLPWGRHPQPSNEMPVHWVEFREGYWIAETEVTNAQYERFRPESERSDFSLWDDSPVIEVEWPDAKGYCDWLAERSGRAVRLPSEAEWECACRAGNGDEYAFGDDVAGLNEHAWFYESAEPHPYPVGAKRANRWGMYDMHGNVSEWCEDSYHASYDDAPADGSPWTEGGEVWRDAPVRVHRGGNCFYQAVDCRSASRFRKVPGDTGWGHGFRPAFVARKN